MKHKAKLAAGLAVLAILLLAGIAFAQSSANFEAVWSRLASGGGERQSANYLAQDIIGQWVSQSPTSSNAQIVTDFFWAGDAISQQIYLPLLIRH